MVLYGFLSSYRKGTIMVATVVLVVRVPLFRVFVKVSVFVLSRA